MERINKKTREGEFPEKERKEVTEEMETRTEIQVAPEKLESMIDYFVELNILKETSGSGWRLAFIPKEKRDSVADHVALTPHWAYVLGRVEGLDASDALRCAGLAVFHDDPETRLGDIDKISARYLDLVKAFPDALREQVSQLPREIGDEIFGFVMEVNSEESREATIVRDADILERALRARIYASAERFRSVEDFFDPKEEEKLQTAGGKMLMSLIRRKRNISTHWRKGLKEE